MGGCCAHDDDDYMMVHHTPGKFRHTGQKFKVNTGHVGVKLHVLLKRENECASLRKEMLDQFILEGIVAGKLLIKAMNIKFQHGYFWDL